MKDAPNRLWPAAFACFALAWAALSLPWLSGQVTIPWDAKAHFYPQLQFLAQSLHRGDTPFWTPFVFSGSPQVADPQSLIFSPPFLALAYLNPDPSLRAFDAVVLGSLGVGALFVMLLFRDRGWHPAGGLVAALAFAFGASAAWRVQHVGQILSLGLWPIALFLLLRALERRSVGWGLLAGLVAGFVAIGRDQVAYLGILLLTGAVLDHWLSRELRGTIGPLFAGALGGALVVAVPVLLTLLLAETSYRPAIDYSGASKGSLHPALLLTGIVPNLFGADGPFTDYWGPPSPRWGPVDLYLARNMGVLYFGALPTAALVACFLRGVFWQREIRFVAVAFVLALLYALGGYTPAFWALFHIPGVELFRRPADATFLIGALGAILGGYGVHAVITKRMGAWGLREALFLLAAFAAALGLALTKQTLPLSTMAIATAAVAWGIAAAGLSILAQAGRVRAVGVALLAVAVGVDLAWNNGPNESTGLPPATYDALRPDSRNETLAVLKSRLGPDSLDRVELAGLGFHWPNASLVHRLHNTLGYNPLRLGAYSASTGAEDHVALPDQRKFSALLPSYRSRLADLLGLRFIATGVPIEKVDPAASVQDFPLVAQTRDGFVHENARAMPRLAVVQAARRADFGEILRSGRWPDVDSTHEVLIEANPVSGAPGDGSVRLVSYRNTEVVADVTSSGGYLVLRDAYHPWWVAEVNGREVPLLRADVIFRTVALPPGSHRVRMIFRPFAGAWRQATTRWPVLAHLKSP